MTDIDRKIERLGASVKARQQAAEDAVRSCLPLDGLRATFGVRIEYVRGIYGTEPAASVPWTDPWVRPKPPKGDYPAVVAVMSYEKRKFLRRKAWFKG